MLVITANTLRQQLTNTEGMECGCDLHSKIAYYVKEKSQFFVSTFISTILLPLLKILVIIRGEKNS